MNGRMYSKIDRNDRKKRETDRKNDESKARLREKKKGREREKQT